MNKTSFFTAFLASLYTINSFGAPIIFTHTGTGTGTIGTVAFTNAAFTITDVGDTVNRGPIPNGSGFYIIDISASISISGVGDFSFTSPTRTFVNNATATVGFSQAGSVPGYGHDLFDGPSNAQFSSWDMLSSIGPINGATQLLQWDFSPTVMTNGGTLRFNSQNNVAGSFKATVMPVPEPSSAVLLLGSGWIWLLKIHRRPAL